MYVFGEYFLTWRVDFLLQTHLPSLIQGLADGPALRKVYTVAFGKGLANLEGEFPGQQDQAFTRSLMGPKTRYSGGGVRRLGAVRLTSSGAPDSSPRATPRARSRTLRRIRTLEPSKTATA